MSDEEQRHDGDADTPPASPPPAGRDGESTPRSPGRAVGNGARATARGLAAAGRATGKAGRSTVVRARRAAGAQGADKSGLNRLIELHAFNAAGDTAVAIALAGTIFFSGATSEQRAQVALFLGLTLLPFTVVAPLIGPFLDRFSHGRRWAIGSTFAIRGFLCWVLAGAVAAESDWMYPAALGVLVASKAYGVTRAAAVPRLQPDDMTLVKTNGRVSLAGVVGATVAAPLAGTAAYFGADWALRLAFCLFVVGTVAAILLPAKVDSQAGEAPRPPRGKRRRALNPPRVAFALRANCGPRWLSGYLTMYLAFLLRENPIEGWEESGTLLLAVVVAAAGLGNALGILTASLARRLEPGIVVVATLLVDVVVVVAAAALYGLVTVVLLGLTAGIAQYLAKVSLDSTIQTDIPPANHARAFARGDTTLQLAWVVGGFCGIAMPLVPQVGLGIAAVALTGWAVFVLRGRPRRRPPTAAASPPPVRHA